MGLASLYARLWPNKVTETQSLTSGYCSLGNGRVTFPVWPMGPAFVIRGDMEIALHAFVEDDLINLLNF